jgi:glycosyltransferase involved in cell wall biosynthesis
VSVVVPTKDWPTFLADTLRTVGAQEGAPIEVVVVYDGSTDATAVESVVAGLQDSRVRLVRPFPARVSAARNTGLTVTSGDPRGAAGYGTVLFSWDGWYRRLETAYLWG